MSPRSIVLFVFLIATALGSWYLSQSDRRKDDNELPLDPIHRGYYLKSARILGTGADGSPLYEIRAAYAEQKNDGSIAFTDVQVRYSPDSNVPWSVNADTAIILPNDQRILLRGHVLAIGSNGDRDTEIRTQYLELDPENYRAETDERVQIRIDARSITATGMVATLQDNHLVLKSNVSGKFVP
jgi:LPS export ABC transporter protein LptC